MPDAEDVSFELERFEWTTDDQLVVVGRWNGVSGRRLLRPAITAALVYSFVRAITSISAVIFLVSAKYNMSTAYIVGLVENGEYGVAIAYSSALILVMIVIIAGFQLLVGERRLRRENRVALAGKAASAPLGQEKTA